MSDRTVPSPVFSAGVLNTPRSFIREILAVTADPDIISFAGGLPDPTMFPVAEIGEAFAAVLEHQGARSLQYAESEGYGPLREWIARSYDRRGLPTRPDEILVTSGSQQGLDLVAKTFLDPGSAVLIERPSYLGALQAFSLARPTFRETTLGPDGPDAEAIRQHAPGSRLFYCVPEFQNPSGTRYSGRARREVAASLSGSGTVLVEDEPYRELFFGATQDDQTGDRPDHRPGDPPLAALYDGPSVSLGSFSKIIAPGLRVGWLRAAAPLMKHLLVARQATDLHTNGLAQMALHRYLTGDPAAFQKRLGNLRRHTRQQRDAMAAALRNTLGDSVSFRVPDGGMFFWIRLHGIATAELLPLALARKVAFVPGLSFFTKDPEPETMRLNFTNSAPDQIKEGVERLASALHDLVRPGQKSA